MNSSMNREIDFKPNERKKKYTDAFDWLEFRRKKRSILVIIGVYIALNNTWPGTDWIGVLQVEWTSKALFKYAFSSFL